MSENTFTFVQDLALPAAKPKPILWDLMKGVAITKEHLKTGTGPIEHLSKDWAKQATGEKSAGNAQKAGIMPFGKHKGRLFSEIQAEDSQYFSWMIREVDGMRAKVLKAGLEIDEN